MTHKTKGIVLRTVKYGETSLVVTVMTELFGIQTYMVNGVRSSKKGSTKAAMYQPTALLNLDVYHNEQKSMQRIREADWAFLYDQVLSDVVKNSIALYMVELLYKTLKQPEANADLFYFAEDCLHILDAAPPAISANMPLFFTLQLSHFFGLRISNIVGPGNDLEEIYLDLWEGLFTTEQPTHPHFMSGENVRLTSELLKINHPSDLGQLTMNKSKRRELLLLYLQYYALHIQDFGQMKTLLVMNEVLG